MPEKWYVLTLFGVDQRGIVARISSEIFKLGANLGETSMSRLGDYFTIMAFVEFSGPLAELQQHIDQAAKDLNLQFHLDALQSHGHQQSTPNIRIRFYGNDRAGLVATVSAALAEAGINIVDLQSDITGRNDSQQFVMAIEAVSNATDAQLQAIVSQLRAQGIVVSLEVVDTLVG